ncbi:MAG: hypothetical protein JO365_29205, partial [Bradyrhizobium sp.]|nr:hypothetical protein [Bradyrhizobium sp.]
MSKSQIAIAALLLATALSSTALARGGFGGGGFGGGGFSGGGYGGGGYSGVGYGGGYNGGGYGGGRYGGGGYGGEGRTFGGGYGGYGYGGGHFGGGHYGGYGYAHAGGGHRGGFSAHVSPGGLRSGHAFAQQHGRNVRQVRSAAPSQANVRDAMNALAHGHAWRSRNLLANPAARAQIASSAALASSHGRHDGWRQHAHGGYGWVGPLFWPFAYFDLYDYTIWGDSSFWDYGYADIYAGIFASDAHDAAAGDVAPRGNAQRPDAAP